MKKVIISCDTTIALTKKEIEKLGIEVIPLNVIADGVEYHDTVDIDSKKLCELMRGKAKISTSTPTIAEIENYFDDIISRKNPDVIIHFTISSNLSSMYSLFTTVCQEKYGDKVIVCDSYSVCNFMANQVRYAKKLADQGASPEEIVKKVSELKDTEKVIFIPESLEFLKRGGRISPTVAAIAGLIGIVPVLTFEHGAVGKKGVTRTAQKAIKQFFEECQSIENYAENYTLELLEFDSKEIVEKTVELAKEYLPGIEINISLISMNVCAHAGPGTIGIGLCKIAK